MKKIIILFIIAVFPILSLAGYVWEDDKDKIYSSEETNVINTNGLDDPLNAGTISTVEGVDGVVNADVSSVDSKQQNIMTYISKWVNYFLGLIGLLLIILIIKEGIVIITSAGEKGPVDKAVKNIKNYILAIIGIGVSYLFINLVFYFINTTTTF